MSKSTMQDTKISYDAPPLDFSNLNIKSLADLKHAVPKQGKRKQAPIDEQKEDKKKEKQQQQQQENENIQVQQNQQQEQEDEDKLEGDEKEREKRELQRQKDEKLTPVIVRTIGQPVQQSTNVYKPTIDEKKQTKKQFQVQLIQCSLILSYNKLTSLHNFYNIIDQIMINCKQLQWIDLSHNMIESLDYNFAELPNVKALYLHANKLKDIMEFDKLQCLTELRTLTVHGNPFDAIPNFRLYVIGLLPTLKKLDSVLISKKELDNANNDQTTYNQNMKLNLEILNYDNPLSNFLVKIKYGTQVHQTAVGNNWNQKFTLEVKKTVDLKVEVWQKDEEFHLIGESIVPKLVQIHHLDIVGQGKKEGVLVVEYKEVELQNPKVNQKLEKPQFLIKRLNESLNTEVQQPYGNIQEYFAQQFENHELSHQSKSTASNLIMESLERTMKGLQINGNQYHFDDYDQKNVIEQTKIKALQKELIKKDLQKYEKSRREVNLQILDLDDMDLRFEQQEQKQQILALRKELVQKLLYIEEKIEHLKRHLKLDQLNKHASQPIMNSMAELSQISMYREPIVKSEVDPLKEQQRQEFIKKQMKEWNELQEQRLKQIEIQKEKIQKTEDKIRKQQVLIQEAKTKEKREEIEQRLNKLKEKQKQREQDLQEQNKRYLEKKKQHHLAEKYAQQDAAYMMSLQDERKNKLKEMRNPEFNIQEIMQFDKKIKELRKEKAAVRQKEWDEREKQWNKFQAQYYSESYKRARQYYKEQDLKVDESKIKAQERLNLLRSYDNEVKQRYQPHVSQEKRSEIEENIRKLKYEPDFKKYRELSEKVKEKHIYFGVEQKDQSGNKKVKLKPLENIPTPISPKRIGDFYLREHATYNKKHIPPIPRPPEPPKSSQSEQKLVIKDYLKEQRIKKQLIEQQSVKKMNQTSGLENDDQKMIMQIKKQLEKLDHI
ncbi:unnamed protein product (macronuclear) [Paramecium tetraurelia]|uniref:Leucine-rich repeat-containing protein 51 n=1 Tax=Paramecium tetraurelia TaxID=5888 RepID=A0DRY4_PARTE|nr:uncharacterized protein GSPATT00019505001 [Paramecium tetraurelia]CAK85801.1 unnamed protein product [Paramecium tetraurelia]|eukprot:XP_001453198.1 hypothetical protein (macronuclear) [Paramecium tetraurelia strain d4-2]